MEARELAADLRVLLVDLALAARELTAVLTVELAAELAVVLALAMLSVSPSPILKPLTRPSRGQKDRTTDCR